MVKTDMISAPLMNAPAGQDRVRELKPIKESGADFDIAEARLRELWRREVYIPLLKSFGLYRPTLVNDIDDLSDAIHDGEIFFWHGEFRGKFTAGVSRELKELGAVWKSGAWRIPMSSLPPDIQAVVRASDTVFKKRLDRIDEKLAQISPAEIAGRFKVADCFDRAIFKTERSFQGSIKGITVAPELTKEQRAKIADEWQNNMRLYVQDWTRDEIKKMRADIQTAAFAGNRRESQLPPILRVTKTVQKSYEQAVNKAKFLARQETSLLMTKYKETRYRDAEVNEYRWGCVSGSKNHPVRPAHKRLEGKVFTWDNPPITTEPDEPARRNNPGQDYNCRCFARPIVRF